MKLTIETTDIKRIYTACSKHVVKGKDGLAHPALCFIQLILDETGQVTATASNSYSLGQTKVPAKGDAGTYYLPVVKLPRTMFGVLENTDNEITLSFDGQKSVYPMPKGQFLNWASVIERPAPVYEICLDASLLAKAAASAADSRGYVHLAFGGNTQPVFITPRKAEADTFSMVLPVRMGS